MVGIQQALSVSSLCETFSLPKTDEGRQLRYKKPQME